MLHRLLVESGKTHRKAFNIRPGSEGEEQLAASLAHIYIRYTQSVYIYTERDCQIHKPILEVHCENNFSLTTPRIDPTATEMMDS